MALRPRHILAILLMVSLAAGVDTKKQRPTKILKASDMTAPNLEKVFRYYDEYLERTQPEIIRQYINANNTNYVAPAVAGAGDITAVTAQTGITGGGSTGSVAVALDTTFAETRNHSSITYGRKTGIRYREHYSSLRAAICDGDTIPDGGIIYGQPAKTDTIRPRYFSKWSKDWPFSLTSRSVWVENGAFIRVASNTHIILPKDYTIVCDVPDTVDMNYRNLGKVVFLIKDVHDVIIEGGTIKSNIFDNDSTSWGEADHTVMIWNSSNITLRDIVFKTPGSDAIDIISDCDNILVENCTFEKNTIRGAQNNSGVDANFNSTTHWTKFGANFTGTNATLALDGTTKALGASSLKVTQTGTNGYACSAVTANESDDYNYRFFVYAATGHGSGNPEIYIGTSAGAKDIETLSFTGRDFWEMKTCKYINTGVHNPIYITFNPSLGDNNAVAYLDEIGGGDQWMIGRHSISIDPEAGHYARNITFRNCKSTADGRGTCDIETYGSGTIVDNVTFDNFVFKGYPDDSDGDGIGIQFFIPTTDTLKNFKAINCTFDSLYTCLYLVGLSATGYYENLVVDKCHLTNSDNGVFADGGNVINWTFSNNEFRKNTTKAFFVAGTASHLDIFNNVFDSNAYGFGFWDEAPYTYTDVRVIGNTFINNTGEAANLRRATNYIFKDNISTNNTTGFAVSANSNNGIIENNIISGNTTDTQNIASAKNTQYGSNKMLHDGKFVVGDCFAGSDPGSINALMTAHDIVFPSYRDALNFTTGAKIGAIKRAGWNSPPYNTWQSSDLAFYTLGNLPTDEDDTEQRMRLFHTGQVEIGPDTNEPDYDVEITNRESDAHDHDTSLRLGDSHVGSTATGNHQETSKNEILSSCYRDVTPNLIGAKIVFQNVSNGSLEWGYNAIQYSNILFYTLNGYSTTLDNTTLKMALNHDGYFSVGFSDIYAPKSLITSNGGVRGDSIIAENVSIANQFKSKGGLVDSINADKLDGAHSSSFLLKSDSTLFITPHDAYSTYQAITDTSTKDATRYWVLSQGFGTGAGDIEGVTAGFGLSGGGNSGSVTVTADTSKLTTPYYVLSQAAVAQWNANKLMGKSVSGTAPTANQVLQYVGSGWIPNDLPAEVGDIASVTAGWGISGGGNSGIVTVTVDTAAGKVATAHDLTSGLAGKVSTTGNENISGVKTFTNGIAIGLASPGNGIDMGGNSSIVGLRDIWHDESTASDFYITNKDEDKSIIFGITGAGQTSRYDFFRMDNDSTIDLGNYSAGNFLEIKKDGTVQLNGNATAWDDMLGPAYLGKQTAGGKPDFSIDSLGYFFPQNDTTEYLLFKFQLSHRYKEGSTIYPHIHWIQNQDQTPVFRIWYQWTSVGETLPAWSYVDASTKEASYTSGKMHQITATASGIAGTGEKVSSILMVKLKRTDNAYVGDCLVTDFDIHFEVDGFGSSTEYSK